MHNWEVHAEASADFLYTCTTPTNGISGWTGCITNDPQFVGASDYRLQVGSPCIDAGNNSYMPASPDLDGVPRPLDGDNDETNTVDMGCYEHLNRAADSDGDTMTDRFERLLLRAGHLERSTCNVHMAG